MPGGFKGSLQNDKKSRCLVNRSLSCSTDKSKEVLYDNFPCEQSFQLKLFQVVKGGAEVSPESEAKLTLA